MKRRPPEPPKPFDLSASHPRPDIRPATGNQSPFTPYTPQQGTPQSQFSTWDPNASGKVSQQATSETQTCWDPKPAAPPITDPAALKNQAWDEYGTNTPSADSEGFTDADALLRQMGLPPLKKPTASPTNDAPYVEPHPTSVAEFSPPRPVRRAPVQFAHLKTKDGDDTTS